MNNNEVFEALLMEKEAGFKDRVIKTVQEKGKKLEESGKKGLKNLSDDIATRVTDGGKSSKWTDFKDNARYHYNTAKSKVGEYAQKHPLRAAGGAAATAGTAAAGTAYALSGSKKEDKQEKKASVDTFEFAPLAFFVQSLSEKTASAGASEDLSVPSYLAGLEAGICQDQDYSGQMKVACQQLGREIMMDFIPGVFLSK